MGCSWLAGHRVSAGDVGQQLRWLSRHGSHSDGRNRGRQRLAVRWSVWPEPRGIPGKVPAGRRPGHRPRCCFPSAVPWWPCRAGGPVAAPPGSVPAGGWARPAAGSSAQPGAPGVCGTGSVVSATGPSGAGRGVGAGTSGPARWMGCGVLTPPGCAASTRRCNPRRPWRLDVPAGGMWVCG